MKVKSQREVTQSCPTLSNLMDCRLPGSSVHGSFQVRVLHTPLPVKLSGLLNTVTIEGEEPQSSEGTTVKEICSDILKHNVKNTVFLFIDRFLRIPQILIFFPKARFNSKNC